MVNTARPLVVALGLATVGFLSGFLLFAVGADRAGVRWSDAPGYTVWDQAHYLSIAEDGYDLISCAEVPGYPPDEWCGNAGWYPGYPALIRAVSSLGLSPVRAAVAISNVALLGVLVLIAWQLRNRPVVERLFAVLGAAWFPGSVFYRAAYPISLTLLGILGALTMLAARRWLAGGLFASVAVLSYPQGLLIGAAAAPLLVAGVSGDRGQLRTAVRFVGLVLLAFLGVLAIYQVATGRWNAWLLVQEKYHHSLHSPIGQWADRIGEVTANEARARVPAIQTGVVLMTMVGVLVTAWLRRSRLDMFALMVLAYSVVVWLIPLSLGQESLYRYESLLLPAALLFGRLPRWLAITILAIFGVLAVPMARLFFEGQFA